MKIRAFVLSYILVVLSASLFTWSLSRVEEFRLSHPFLLFALPLLIVLVGLDRRQKADVLTTRREVLALRDQTIRPVSFLAGIKQIAFTLMAHALGASVGREAVGLQLGGWSARLQKTHDWFFGVCLAAGFAIVLGTPWAAAVFIFESRKWRVEKKAWFLIPLLAWIAYRVSLLLGVEHSLYHQFAATESELIAVGATNLAALAVSLVIFGSLLSAAFLFLVERVTKSANSLFVPLIFLGATLVLFYIVGFSQSEGMGLPGLGVSAFDRLAGLDPSQSMVWYFHPVSIAVAKVALTAGFVGIGVRGGELTPLLAAGSMLAVGLGLFFGIPVSGLVAIGFPLVWGIAARRPVTAGVLAMEVFGSGGWGGLGVITMLLVVIGLKLGDKLLKNKDPGTWRRGLYD